MTRREIRQCVRRGWGGLDAPHGVVHLQPALHNPPCTRGIATHLILIRQRLQNLVCRVPPPHQHLRMGTTRVSVLLLPAHPRPRRRAVKSSCELRSRLGAQEAANGLQLQRPRNPSLTWPLLRVAKKHVVGPKSPCPLAEL